MDRAFLLKVVQPSLVGLIDGSISTLAPLFAAAFASHDPHITFLVGTAAAIGAAISMAFAEGLSDTGEHTGRGHPAIRGSIVGAATFIGGIFHTLPFLVPDLNTALTLAYIVVAVELIAISYIRFHYFKLSFGRLSRKCSLVAYLYFSPVSSSAAPNLCFLPSARLMHVGPSASRSQIKHNLAHHRCAHELHSVVISDVLQVPPNKIRSQVFVI